jgi:large subunit ribosomal protein L22
MEKNPFKTSVKASLNNTKVSPRKARLVVDLIRGKQVDSALQILKFSPKKSARLIEKLLNSAISNARENYKLDIDKLWVSGCYVNMSKTLKRYMPRAQGRATPIKKRSSDITVELVNLE